MTEAEFEQIKQRIAENTKSVPERIAVKAKGRVQRHEVGKRNKTEQRFETEVLAPGKLAGDVIAFHFEQIKLRLADNTYYTPDFFAIYADGSLVFHEIKGMWRDDARVKIKIAAEQFPVFQFQAWTWNKKEGWGQEVIESGLASA